MRLLVYNDEWWVHMGRNCPLFIVTQKKKKKKNQIVKLGTQFGVSLEVFKLL